MGSTRYVQSHSDSVQALTGPSRSSLTPATPPFTHAVTAPSSSRASPNPGETVEMTATSMGTTTTTTILSKTADNIINTPAGVVHVRPYRSSSNAQLKALLSFEPRVSSLDRTNTRSQTDEFRGFFVLFWIGT